MKYICDLVNNNELKKKSQQPTTKVVDLGQY